MGIDQYQFCKRQVGYLSNRILVTHTYFLRAPFDLFFTVWGAQFGIFRSTGSCAVLSIGDSDHGDN